MSDDLRVQEDIRELRASARKEYADRLRERAADPEAIPCAAPELRAMLDKIVFGLHDHLGDAAPLPAPPVICEDVLALSTFFASWCREDPEFRAFSLPAWRREMLMDICRIAYAAGLDRSVQACREEIREKYGE